MEWLLGAGAAVAVAAFWLGRVFGKTDARDAKNEAWRSDRGRLEAEARYLEYLRRDIALALLDEDPKLLLDSHATVAGFTRSMRDGTSDRLLAERKVLELKYPKFDDFDLFGLRHFVPVDPHSFERREAVERYVDIGKYLIIMSAEHGLLQYMTDDQLVRDRQVLERVVERRGDQALIAKTDEAVGRYYAWIRSGGEGAFDDAEFRVERMALDYTPEVEYGITLKSGGVRIVWGHYTFDDDRNKTVYSYNLADERWQRVRSLSKR